MIAAIYARKSTDQRKPGRERIAAAGPSSYEARQRCIEATPVGETYARLRQTEKDLAAVIASLGIVLPVVEL